MNRLPSRYLASILLVASFVSPQLSSGQTTTWTGNINSNFSNSGNWSSGVPNPGTKANFLLNGLNQVDFSGNGTADDVIVSNGNWTFQGTNGDETFDISDDFELREGNLLIKNMSLAGISDGSRIIVGRGPGDSTMTIASDATVSGNLGYIGQAAFDTGIVDVSGQWNNSGSFGDLYVGWFGKGTLNINPGGTVTNSRDTYIGFSSSSNNSSTVTVGGVDSKLVSGRNLILGGASSNQNGTGVLNVNSDGLVETTDRTRLWNSNTTINLNGGTLKTGQLDTESGNLNFNSGTITINGDGDAATNDFQVGNTLTLGSNSGTSTLNLESNSNATVATSFTVDSGGVLNFGRKQL